MKTIAVNAAVIVWVSLLLFAPAIVWCSYRRPTPMTFAAGGGTTLALVSLVTYVAGLNGIGSLIPLRICAIVLGLLLAWAVVNGAIRIARQWPSGSRPSRAPSPDWATLPLGLFLGVWVLVSPLKAIGRQGLTFGLASLGNPDIANYTLASQNTALSGFTDSHHLANLNLGSWSRDESYIGASALINFVSAATGLSPLQATFATMGVAVCLLAVGLWALGRTIWPSSPFAVGASVVVACLCGMSAYIDAQFFLGSVLGLTGVAIALAGATALAKEPNRQAMLAVAGGGAAGIYCYAHLGLPLVVLLPFWAVFAAFVGGQRGARRLFAVVARSVVAVIGALALAAVALNEAFNLIRVTSKIEAGYPLPVPTSVATFVWPTGIGPDPSRGAVVASWLFVFVAIAVALAAAWRRGLHGPVRIAAILTLACVTLTIIFGGIYGPDRYQSWKIGAFLLPLAVVVALPAVGATATGISRIGRPMLGAAIGAVLLCPILVWSPSLHPVNPGKITTSQLIALGRSPALAGVASVNIRLPSPLQTMAAGASISRSSVIFTQNSYYSPVVSLNTCTVTILE